MSNKPSRLSCHSRTAIGSEIVRLLFLVVLLGAALCILAGCATSREAIAAERGPSPAGRSKAEFEADKSRAVALWYDEHDGPEALLLLEALAAENPADRDVMELLSGLLFATYGPREGSTERTKALLRSRDLARKAKASGSTFVMMDLILNNVSAEGEFVQSFSGDRTVDEVMKKGEGYFAANDVKHAP